MIKKIIALIKNIALIITLGLALCISLNINAKSDHAIASDPPISTDHTQEYTSSDNDSPNNNPPSDNLSLKFQDIEIRSVLQLLAEFSGYNIIVSDTVKGNLTLSLDNVPWTEVLDIVLRTKALDKRHIGEVILIAPQEEITLREKQQLESQKQLEALGLLHSELIQINYAKAEELANLLKDKTNSLMTQRGTVSIDKRINALLIQDTQAKLSEIKNLLRRLDVPVRQVEIATQIITADNTIEEALGLRFNATSTQRLSGNSIANGLFSDLPSLARKEMAKLGFSFAYLPNHILLELELQALEYESRVKTLAKPKLTTIDQNRAYVETGVEIPYQETTAGGAASVAFKKAVLKLEVIPQITPNNKILLDLTISNDSQGTITTQNTGPDATSRVVGINTNKLQTKVLVNNNSTIVLGGVLTLNEGKTCAKVPILGDLPIVGNLFRNRYKTDSRKELLIFITPRIIENGN